MTTLTLETAGRRDVSDFFDKSGIRTAKRLAHNPFLVFVVKAEEDRVEVVIIDNASDLLNYQDRTQVMAQWPGRWNSDFFQFTVGEFRQHINDSPIHDALKDLAAPIPF